MPDIHARETKMNVYQLSTGTSRTWDGYEFIISREVKSDGREIEEQRLSGMNENYQNTVSVQPLRVKDIRQIFECQQVESGHGTTACSRSCHGVRNRESIAFGQHSAGYESDVLECSVYLTHSRSHGWPPNPQTLFQNDQPKESSSSLKSWFEDYHLQSDISNLGNAEQNTTFSIHQHFDSYKIKRDVNDSQDGILNGSHKDLGSFRQNGGRMGGQEEKHDKHEANQEDREDGDDTWLILPVVICLSQRLSHAGASTS